MTGSRDHSGEDRGIQIGKFVREVGVVVLGRGNECVRENSAGSIEIAPISRCNMSNDGLSHYEELDMNMERKGTIRLANLGTGGLVVDLEVGLLVGDLMTLQDRT